MNDKCDENQPERHSKAFEAELITDPEELARREARNGLRQYDQVLALIEYFLHPDRPFRLRPSHILHLHRTALEGISSYAGNYRPANIQIQGSKHTPAGAHLVPEKIEDLCDYINTNWKTRTPIHLASYVLWRLNWIHPFTDGNGRTSRATSYAVLCIRLGYALPGTQTIPEQISRDKAPYYRALEASDRADSEGRIDLTELEAYLGALLAKQLLGVHEQATKAAEGGKAEDDQ